MARSVATVIDNNFVKGLVTEATGLQYPENSVVETFDCIFDVLGSVQRRKGFDYEYGYTTQTITKAASAMNTYLWKNSLGDGLVSFLVVQIGSILHFYSAADGSTSLSGNVMSQTIDLAGYKAAGSPDINQFECQFSDGLSKLFVVHPCLNNFYITYSGGVFSTTAFTIRARDFEGVNDGYAVDFKPVVLATNDNHRYNLYNQGWTADKFTAYQTAFTAYPSNSEQWWMYKDYQDLYNPTTAKNNTRGTSKAPNGHFILNVYTGDRDTASGLSGILSTNSGAARTSVTAFFAGRAWYGGISAAGFNSKIYFSRIITSDAEVGQCYQEADPTNEDVFELQPDDGGVISIPEAGTIYKLMPVMNSLIVFAYRGIFQITGSTGLGFTATDYVVSRLSTVRSISSTSYVDINGLPVFWNTDGIWGIQPTKDGSGLQVNTLTRNTIQSFYDEIPTVSKLYARGFFNPLTQIVSWIYRDDPGDTIDEQYQFNAVLNFNIVTGAFYPWRLSPGVNIHGIVVIDGTGGLTQELQIIDELANQVVDDLGNLIVGYELTNASVAAKTKYLVSNGTTFTFAETNDDSYTDWVTANLAVTYESYFITGYKLLGQATRDFQSNYVTVYNEGTGVLYIQGVWDFSVQTSTGRQSVKQLCRYEDTGYSNQFRRVKIRGHGKSLQYRIASQGSNSFNVIGWSAWTTQNSAI